VSFLDRVRVEKQAEVEALLLSPPALVDLRPTRGLHAALTGTALAAIAEIKRRSPTRGDIRPGADPIALAQAYEKAGASAISMLTDGPHFGGSMAELRAVREAIHLPVLRKDFLIHPIQIDEARAGGADAVLLIVAMLNDLQLQEMLARTKALNMEALVEVHDTDELQRALRSPAKIIGVNNRNLKSLKIDLANGERMLPLCDADRVRVAESGIFNAHDLERMRNAGADAILVGSALMLAPDPGKALEALLCQA
jgi:indole-3-glycerol phosphate synthase